MSDGNLPDTGHEFQEIIGLAGNDQPVSDNERAIVESTLNKLQPAASSEIIIPDPEAIARVEPPWTLQQFFNGQIDLDAELAKRFQNVPMMTTVKFRDLGQETNRGVATLTTPDGAAQVIFDADKSSRIVQMSFTWGSMLTLRFTLQKLSDTDRTRWLRLMKRKEGGLAFLWGPTRWEQDYMICISRKFFTNIYAFSPNGYEAAVRLSPEVMNQLLDWLQKFWEEDSDTDDQSPKLLTW